MRLRTGSAPSGETPGNGASLPELQLDLTDVTLPGDLELAEGATGVVVFAHGSGSSRHSPRNRAVAERLRAAGFATLLFDLLTEEESADRRNVFDIGLLGDRLAEVVDRLGERPDVRSQPVGLFGASTGAGAALNAAVARPDRVRAVVSRGGRPDLAAHLERVETPTLLIVGGADTQVIELNRGAQARMPGVAELRVVAGAGHLFEGPGQLEEVADHAAAWFARWLT